MKLRLSAVLISAASILSMSALTGCVSTLGNESVKNVTTESLSQRIIKGKSTKTDVTRELGQPQGNDIDEGRERWMYSYSTSKGSVASALPFVGLFSQNQQVEGKMVYVYFNKNGTVYDVQVSESHNSYRGGIGM